MMTEEQGWQDSLNWIKELEYWSEVVNKLRAKGFEKIAAAIITVMFKLASRKESYGIH